MTHGTTGRRVAAVSTGTLLLCLWAGGTAFAATAPVADGSTGGGVIGTVTSVLPSPTTSPLPVATPSQLDPVSQTVDQVTKTVTQSATTNPTATPTPVPTGGNVSTTGKNSGSVSLPKAGSTDRHVLGTHQSRAADVAPMPAMPLMAGGLRASAGAPPVSMLNPQVAPEQQAVLAAGSAPAVAPAPGAALPGSHGDQAPRGLFIALATMVIGGLAAGHVKVAQDRMGVATV